MSGASVEKSCRFICRDLSLELIGAPLFGSTIARTGGRMGIYACVDDGLAEVQVEP
jgi:hypothetical protein